MLEFEIVCHHVEPCYILCAYSIAKLNPAKQHGMLLDVISVIRNKRRVIIPLMSDNVLTNATTFKLMGGPQNVKLEHECQLYFLFLVYD